jgi:hypothetical protein
MRNNNDMTMSIGHITDSEVVVAIRYLDPVPTNRTTTGGRETVIVVVFSILMCVLATLSFISLYLRAT